MYFQFKLTNWPGSKMIVCLFGLFTLALNFSKVPNVLSWDVFGYYLYLPATFIYHDLDQHAWTTSILNSYDVSSTLYQLVDLHHGGRLIRYSMGWAMLNLPFFMLGHLAASLFGFPVDGFSAPYVYSITLGYCLYVIAGIWLLRMALLKFFNDRLVSWILVCILFGTNILHLCIEGTGMPHMYLFALYGLLLYVTHCYHESPKNTYAVVIGLLLGLLVVTRPSEMIAVLIPLFWNVTGLRSFREKTALLLNRHWQHLLLVVFSGMLVCVPQLIYWHVLTGNIIFYSYQNPGEGFDFMSPHTFDFLFSFRKGWLLYTPIMIVALLGFYQLFKRKKDVFWGLVLFTLFNIYILSSWSNWWYAESFSQRSMAQSYAILAIPLGFYLSSLSQKIPIYKWGVVFFISLCICLNLFQTWQMSKGILDSARMTREAYFGTFLKVEKPGDLEEKLLLDRQKAEMEGMKEKEYELNKSYHLYDGPTGPHVFGHASPFSQSISLRHSEITSRDHAWIRVRGQIKINECRDCSLLLVTTYERNKSNYHYRTHSIFPSASFDTIPLVHETFSFDYLTPEPRSGSDFFKTYLWISAGQAEVVLKQLNVSVFEKADKNDGLTN